MEQRCIEALKNGYQHRLDKFHGLMSDGGAWRNLRLKRFERMEKMKDVAVKDENDDSAQDLAN
eukprot:scaffold2036_cov39-Cyclotella_meneghiniana.AAC.1